MSKKYPFRTMKIKNHLSFFELGEIRLIFRELSVILKVGIQGDMELSAAAQSLSEKAVKIRTRLRDVTCLACGKHFTARSPKAQFCSVVCYRKVDYRSKDDPLAKELGKIQRRIKKLIGENPRVDPTLRKISSLLSLARMNNSTHLSPSSIPWSEW